MEVEALCSAFWIHIIICLQKGDEETRLWLDTGEEPLGFLWWCDVSNKEPQSWRKRLLPVYTENPSSAVDEGLLPSCVG